MPKNKCWVCGAGATEFPVMYKYNKWHTDREPYSQRAYCKECFEKYSDDMKHSKTEYIRLRKKLMFERAVRMFERQDVDVYEYEEALKAVEDFSETNLEKFDSAEEMLAAAILIDNELRIEIGKQVGKYTVDVYIPELYVLLEIDGATHGGRVYYDNERDKELRKELGGKWEVVRIKTDYIQQNAELLVEAIKRIYAEKKKLRQDNNGLLPDWYSRREFAKKPKRQEYADDLLIT